MLTKKNMWYMTLFSIILVMAVCYVSFSEKDLKKVSNEVKTEEKALVTIKESENLTALRVSRDEKLEKEMAEVKKILKQCMEGAANLKVPLIAEISEANNWYDCK